MDCYYPTAFTDHTAPPLFPTNAMGFPSRSRDKLILTGLCALLGGLSALTGCQNNPFQRPAGTAGALSPGQTSALQSEQQKLTAQLADLNRRLGQMRREIDG